MKTRIMIKNLRLSLLAFFLMMISVSGYSQVCPGNLEGVTLGNFTQTATTFEFDYMISNQGSTTMTLNALSVNVLYSAGMLPAGATGTVTSVATTVSQPPDKRHYQQTIRARFCFSYSTAGLRAVRSLGNQPHC